MEILRRMSLQGDSLKKQCIFAFKIVKQTFFKTDFLFLISVLPVVYCGGGEISPTVKPNSRSRLEAQPMFPFSWGVMWKKF